VLGMTNLLLDSGLNEDQREMAQTVESCGENLLRVLNDVLDFSTMEAGKLSLHALSFNLCELIGQSLALSTPQAARKGIGLGRDFGPGTAGRFWGDPGRIRQVLDNLVGNALKFTETGRVTVAVRVESEEANGAVVLISVNDTGIGIAPEDQSRLFHTFSQVDGSDRRKYGGTGLGLAICKRIVELMGGEIGLTSEAGLGSCFWFRLPLPRQPAATC
jgi:two-component system sensor histidine kinase/response regulator